LIGHVLLFYIFGNTLYNMIQFSFKVVFSHSLNTNQTVFKDEILYKLIV